MKPVLQEWPLVLLLLSLLPFALLSACGQQQLMNDSYVPVQPPAPPATRPDIPRVPLPAQSTPPGDVKATPPGDVQSSQHSTYQHLLNQTALVRPTAHGFYVGSPYDPLLVNDTIGEHMPVLTKEELPWLVGKPPGWPSTPVPFEQVIRFDFGNETSGRLLVERDPRSEKVEPFLFFQEGKPMFEYAYLLYGSNFRAMKGWKLSFFGDTYAIQDASPSSLTLYGVDVDRYLTLVNNSPLRVNGLLIPDTRVWVDEWSVIIRFLAPKIDKDGIRLFKGERLRKKLKHPEILLNPAFDIVFEGMEQTLDAGLEFRNAGDRVRVSLLDLAGNPSRFFTGCPFQRDDERLWGTPDEPLHVKECAYNDFCIRVDDSFLLTTRSGLSSIFKFRGINDIGSVVILQGPHDKHLVRLAETGQMIDGKPVLEGALGIAETLFKVRVLFEKNGTSLLAVDQDGDGGVSGRSVPYVLQDGYELHFSDEACNISLLTNLPYEEGLNINFRKDEEYRVGTNLPLSQIEDEDDWRGVTKRGLTLTLKESDDGTYGDSLLIQYPLDYAAGLVRIVSVS